MRKILLALAISGLALASSGASAAEANFSSADVVDFMLKSAELGDTRGICVGTAEECGQTAAPAGFDVMVNFELNSDVLTPDAIVNLREVARALADPRLQDAKFAIEGHTDALGTEAYNDDLAQRRALSVAAFLTGEGVPAERLVAVGLGESTPRVDDPFAPINRRVEMRINLN